MIPALPNLSLTGGAAAPSSVGGFDTVGGGFGGGAPSTGVVGSGFAPVIAFPGAHLENTAAPSVAGVASSSWLTYTIIAAVAVGGLLLYRRFARG